MQFEYCRLIEKIAVLELYVKNFSYVMNSYLSQILSFSKTKQGRFKLKYKLFIIFFSPGMFAS